jgi:hypothetical protein
MGSSRSLTLPRKSKKMKCAKEARRKRLVNSSERSRILTSKALKEKRKRSEKMKIISVIHQVVPTKIMEMDWLL